MRGTVAAVLALALIGCQPARTPSEACRRQNMAKRIGRSANPDPRLDAIEDIRCDEMEREERREAREDAHRAAQARTSVQLPPPSSDPPRAKMASSPPTAAPLATGPRRFECESHPSGGSATRRCLPNDVNHVAMCKEGGGCFSQDSAMCFFASRSRDEMALRMGPVPTEEWSPTEVGQKCFATAAECDASRDKFGRASASQPPVRAACIPITAREATSDP